jgi:hypothetical protein
MMSHRRGVLEDRRRALMTFILFACFSGWSWARLGGHYFDRDPIYLGGLVFAIFITASIASRSPLLADRIAFTAVAIAFLLTTVLAAVALGPTATLVVTGAKSLMWTAAAVVGLLVLLRGSGR